jgi:hypothetical protein
LITPSICCHLPTSNIIFKKVCFRKKLLESIERTFPFRIYNCCCDWYYCCCWWDHFNCLKFNKILFIYFPFLRSLVMRWAISWLDGLISRKTFVIILYKFNCSSFSHSISLTLNNIIFSESTFVSNKATDWLNKYTCDVPNMGLGPLTLLHLV